MTSGSFRIRFISVFRRLMISGGVPAGAITPPHDTDSKPGRPDSVTVGTSGSEGIRLALVTAIARSLPDLTFGIAAIAVGNATAMAPDITSVRLGVSPL